MISNRTGQNLKKKTLLENVGLDFSDPRLLWCLYGIEKYMFLEVLEISTQTNKHLLT